MEEEGQGERVEGVVMGYQGICFSHAACLFVAMVVVVEVAVAVAGELCQP